MTVGVKKELRSKFRALRRSFGGQVSPAVAKQLTDHLLKFWQNDDIGIWASYRACDGEPNLAEAVDKAPSELRFAYPRMGPGGIRFLMPLEAGAWEVNRRIEEPIVEKSKVIETKDLAGVLVPGVAFDHFGGRLGQGKGYYDQALASFTGKKVGIAWSCQVADEALPMEAHDVKLDWVVTERGVITCRRG